MNKLVCLEGSRKNLKAIALETGEPASAWMNQHSSHLQLCLFFELVDGVVEFLHRERRHCVLKLVVLVLVFVGLRR